MRYIFENLKTYSIFDICKMGYSFVMTRLLFPGALLVRRPIFIRQRSSFRFGKGLTTGRCCRIEGFETGEIVLGDHCQLGDYVHLVSSEMVSIGDNCLIASKVFISDTSHGSYGLNGSSPNSLPADRELISNPVCIGDCVWIGENAVVLPGSQIGNGCVIGANSTVNSVIPDNCIAVGSPARVVKRYSESTWHKV